MELFYRRHKGKVIFTLVIFVLGVIAIIVNQVMKKVYSGFSLQADISFWISTVLILATIAMGIFLMILEYVQVQKR